MPSRQPAAASSATAKFLQGLPVDRRAEAALVLDALRRHMPDGYEEALAGKMLVFQVPLAVYPDTYNRHPLWYVALASEKSYLSLHLMPVYGERKLAEQLEAGFKAAGKKLNMGKACVRFRSAKDLELDVIGEIVGSIPMPRWVEIAKAAGR